MIEMDRTTENLTNMSLGDFQPKGSNPTAHIPIDDDTEMAPWFVCGMSSDQVSEKILELQQKGLTGHFLVHDAPNGRESPEFELTVVASPGLTKTLTIKYFDGSRGDGGFEIVQEQSSFGTGGKRFNTISEMVETYSKDPMPKLQIKLVGEAQFQSSFPDALGRRTTSRRDRSNQRNEKVDLSHLGKANKDFAKKKLSVDATTKNSYWFLSGTDRDALRRIVHALMLEGQPGAFIVRDKKNVEGLTGAAISQVYALNVKINNKTLMCYLIEKKKKKYFVRGTDEMFESISELIKYYVQEARDSMNIKLEYPEDSYIQAAIEEARKEAAKPGSSNQKYNFNGLPGWLRVDADIKANVRASTRKRAEDTTALYEIASEGNSDGTPMYDTASNNNTPEYDIATKRRSEVGGPEYAIASRDVPNKGPVYAEATPTTNGADYDIANGSNSNDTDTPQYATARRESEGPHYDQANNQTTTTTTGPEYARARIDTGVYANDDDQGAAYAMAQPGQEVGPAFTAKTGIDKNGVYQVSVRSGNNNSSNNGGAGTYDNVARDGVLYAEPKPVGQDSK